MKHLNGNLMCCIDCETTGVHPEKHDILSIAIIPLDNMLNVHKKIVPFILKLKPRFPENADPQALAVSRTKLAEHMVNGVEYHDAADLFHKWYENLKLPFKKHIYPLGQNWNFDRAFLAEWLGWYTVNDFFSSHYRDTMSTASYLNDRADFHGEPYPFQKQSLSFLCSALDIPYERGHDPVQDCLLTIKVYKAMMNVMV